MIVFNGTNVRGLAAGYADRLESAGFSEVAARNWRGYGISRPTVLYNQAQFKETAEAVGAELGYPVVQSPNLQINGVAVVVFR